MSYLNRRLAADYLNERGVAASRSALARMAMTGEGPKYVIIRQRAYYTHDWLNDWLERQTPFSCAMEHLTRNGGTNV